ncbi:hypothetical protein TNCV_4182661 [Trichonephila clavipes]|nr:hypothetical protein TNCV_4182661 [Trichonephila clavipes]
MSVAHRTLECPVFSTASKKKSKKSTLGTFWLPVNESGQIISEDIAVCKLCRSPVSAKSGMQYSPFCAAVDESVDEPQPHSNMAVSESHQFNFVDSHRHKRQKFMTDFQWLRLNLIESPEEAKKLAVATQKTSNPDNFENIETRTKEQNKTGLAKFCDVFGSNSNSENTRNPSQEAEKELNEYLSMPRVSFEHDPLDWWKVHYESFPSLKVIARKYLCIQGSSVASDRVFSVQVEAL